MKQAVALDYLPIKVTTTKSKNKSKYKKVGVLPIRIV